MNPSTSQIPFVTQGSFLTLHYRLAGPQGDIINTFLEKPATLSLGKSELSPAMEEKLMGLSEGTRATFEIPKDQAFGSRNSDMLQWVSRQLLKQMGDPLETYQIGEVVEFPAPNGQGTYAGSVQQVAEDAVLFDFNHPLAGHAVTVEVEIIGVL